MMPALLPAGVGKDEGSRRPLLYTAEVLERTGRRGVPDGAKELSPCRRRAVGTR
jgi:hypothetical protein